MPALDVAARRARTDRPPRILIVDDDTDTREAILECISRSIPWADVLDATGAEEAWQMLRRMRVDLVVSDQRMGGMDGLTLLRRVRFEYPAVTRILLTGHPDLETNIEAVQDAVADQYLLKPVSPRRLSYFVALQLWVQHEDGRCPLPPPRAAELKELVRSLGLGLRMGE